MKRILTIIILLTTYTSLAGGGGCSSFMNVVPVSHPNGCNAIELRNLDADAGSNMTWTFSPAAINAATGTSVTSMVVNSSTLGVPPVWPVVYWPAASVPSSGTLTIGYDGCTQDFNTCDCNPFAAGDFYDAPLICNTSHYCGNTAAAYIEDFLQNGTPAGGLGANGDGCTFCGSYTTDHQGSIENNSWLKFIADATTVDFNINVFGGCYIQFAVYAYNPAAPLGSNGVLTLMTPIEWTNVDTGFTGANTITASGLVPGNEYYLHFDGHGGADCDYEIGFSGGIVTSNLTASDNLVCSGDAVTLTATPQDPAASYTWTDNFGNTYSGSDQITVNPSVATTYSVQIDLPGCQPNPEQVLVDIEPCPLPSEVVGFSVSCDEGKNQLKWETATEYNVDRFEIWRSSDLEVFEIVGSVTAAGNSLDKQEYSFTDYAPGRATEYYKLVSVDFDGETDETGYISTEKCYSDTDWMRTYYDQSKGKIVLESFVSTPQQLAVSLTTLNGSEVKSAAPYAQSGLNIFVYDVDDYSGLLLINVSSESDLYMNKHLVK